MTAGRLLADLFRFGLFGASLLGSAVPALAQAWLPPKGEATFSFAYTNVFVKEHFYNSGERFDHGRIYSHTFSPGLSYGITDRLTLSLGLPPFVSSRYDGVNPHALPIDDGAYKPAFQDFQPELRFMALRSPVVVTAFLGGVLPSHDYQYLGHSAIGRDVRDLRMGVNLGWRMDPILPDAYLHARYAYVVSEKVIGISHNNSDVDLEFGYFVTPALTLRGMSNWRIGYGGLRLGTGDLKSDINFQHHDQVMNEQHWNVGAGASYALTGAIDVFAGWFKTLSGRNGHAIDRGLSIGASVNFSPAQLSRRAHKTPQPLPQP